MAILSLIEADLLELDFAEINEYFKQFKEETASGDSQYTLLPETEKIITTAYKFKTITDDRVNDILRMVRAEEQ